MTSDSTERESRAHSWDDDEQGHQDRPVTVTAFCLAAAIWGVAAATLSFFTVEIELSVVVMIVLGSVGLVGAAVYVAVLWGLWTLQGWAWIVGLALFLAGFLIHVLSGLYVQAAGFLVVGGALVPLRGQVT